MKIYISLFGIGILIEFITAYFFSNVLVGIYINAYLLLCIILTWVSNWFLKLHFKSDSSRFYLLPLLLSIFIPGFGIIISPFIVIALYRSSNKSYKFTETIYDPINLKQVTYSTEHYGAGGAFLQLMKKNEAPVNRIKALFVLARGQLALINNMLQGLLPDSSDEIRLLSFNILDQQEGFIQNDINRITAIMNNDAIDAINRAKCEKNLAQLYWEQSYRHLILKELKDTNLKKALSHAISSLEVLHNDAAIWSLLGKIYYRLNQYTLAEDAFKKALTLNTPASQVLPYLAEISFKTKDYAAVKNYLGKSDALWDIALIAPVKRFWEKK